MSLPAGVPRNSARPASTIVENGLMSAAKVCSQSGIDSGGTNADEAKVSGKIAMKPNAFADSGEETISPIQANTHENV